MPPKAPANLPHEEAKPSRSTSCQNVSHHRPRRTGLVVIVSVLVLVFLIPSLLNLIYENGKRAGIESGFINGYVAGYYDGESGNDAYLSSPEYFLNDTVYVTETGSKYHENGCQYLHSSKIPTTYLDAIADGYSRCSRCDP